MIVFICLIIAAGIVAAILITDYVIKNSPDRVKQGVTLSGVDISGMTKEQVLDATSQVPQDLLATMEVSIDFNGEISKFSAQDLGLATDYDSVVDQALAYGHADSGAQPSEAGGKDFTVHLQADKAKIASLIKPVAEKYNKQPVNATVQFMPWGYLSDGTPYQPDVQAIIEACADKKMYDQPQNLVRFTADQMPNKLRYEYWQNTKYVAKYIPKDANIARFLYKDGAAGQSVDVDALVNTVVSQVQNGDIATIKVPIKPIQPTVTLDALKEQTQLVASWTSSFSNHLGYNRNWNVAKLSGIINGVVIQPGETWSINKQAGNRTEASGWLKAAGIELGGYTQQPGGGVCQISSTLYNAAIRSALDIADSSHHSISSDYIPLGLDATISSGGPDLEIKNPNSAPIYIVSYVNPKDNNVTVEIYGQTVNDPTYGDVILDFSSVAGPNFGAPGINYVYNAAIAPDQTPIAAGQSYAYAPPRQGKSVKTFKYFISLDGQELDAESFGSYTWNPMNGTTYVNAPAPPAAAPTPPPAAVPSDATQPTASATGSVEPPPPPLPNLD